MNLKSTFWKKCLITYISVSMTAFATPTGSGDPSSGESIESSMNSGASEYEIALEDFKKNPSSFDEVWYLAQNPDALKEVQGSSGSMTGLDHYESTGKNIGRFPTPKVKEVWLLDFFKDKIGANNYGVALNKKNQDYLVNESLSNTPDLLANEVLTDAITKVFQDLLEREPTANELENWINQIKNNGMTIAQLGDSLKASKEYADKNKEDEEEKKVAKKPKMPKKYVEAIDQDELLSSPEEALKFLAANIFIIEATKSFKLIDESSRFNSVQDLNTGYMTAQMAVGNELKIMQEQQEMLEEIQRVMSEAEEATEASEQVDALIAQKVALKKERDMLKKQAKLYEGVNATYLLAELAARTKGQSLANMTKVCKESAKGTNEIFETQVKSAMDVMLDKCRPLHQKVDAGVYEPGVTYDEYGVHLGDLTYAKFDSAKTRPENGYWTPFLKAVPAYQAFIQKYSGNHLQNKEQKDFLKDTVVQKTPVLFNELDVLIKNYEDDVPKKQSSKDVDLQTKTFLDFLVEDELGKGIASSSDDSKKSYLRRVRDFFVWVDESLPLSIKNDIEGGEVFTSHSGDEVGQENDRIDAIVQEINNNLNPIISGKTELTDGHIQGCEEPRENEDDPVTYDSVCEDDYRVAFGKKEVLNKTKELYEVQCIPSYETAFSAQKSALISLLGEDGSSASSTIDMCYEARQEISKNVGEIENLFELGAGMSLTNLYQSGMFFGVDSGVFSTVIRETMGMIPMISDELDKQFAHPALRWGMWKDYADISLELKGLIEDDVKKVEKSIAAIEKAIEKMNEFIEESKKAEEEARQKELEQKMAQDEKKKSNIFSNATDANAAKNTGLGASQNLAAANAVVEERKNGKSANSETECSVGQNCGPKSKRNLVSQDATTNELLAVGTKSLEDAIRSQGSTTEPIALNVDVRKLNSAIGNRLAQKRVATKNLEGRVKDNLAGNAAINSSQGRIKSMNALAKILTKARKTVKKNPGYAGSGAMRKGLNKSIDKMENVSSISRRMKRSSRKAQTAAYTKTRKKSKSGSKGQTSVASTVAPKPIGKALAKNNAEAKKYDINSNKNVSIFKVISNRYFKSAMDIFYDSGTSKK
jgi:hypothetical protein